MQLIKLNKKGRYKLRRLLAKHLHHRVSIDDNVLRDYEGKMLVNYEVSGRACFVVWANSSKTGDGVVVDMDTKYFKTK